MEIEEARKTLNSSLQENLIELEKQKDGAKEVLSLIKRGGILAQKDMESQRLKNASEVFIESLDKIEEKLKKAMEETDLGKSSLASIEISYIQIILGNDYKHSLERARKCGLYKRLATFICLEEE